MLRGMFELSDYPALNLAGDNYLEWIKNTRVALSSRGLGNCLNEYLNIGILESEMHRAITIIRYHLAEELRDLYLHVEDPCALWLQLGQRFKPVLLQKANDQWETIRFTDFKSVDEYNSALMDIVDGLILCDEIITNEDLIYKTYSTFHPEDVQLINKAKKFTIYEDLLSYLLASDVL
ncbi:PREDICTED: uncharacterized protein LOC106321461 [Brassica oleracea var. oleracea]|uniref:uncharacterized protein LOC106321461 n=1 Tax=Brassica oleracea var. oleracea TaxID=109376 RepID=UPI0006A6AF41|nr:PREDICTED: uncharacterized protein LOC106321461 [Brassica oleracea var. oleracea]